MSTTLYYTTFTYTYTQQIMANILPSYLADLISAFNDKSSDRIAALVPLHPAHQAYRPLQSALQSVSLWCPLSTAILII